MAKNPDRIIPGARPHQNRRHGDAGQCRHDDWMAQWRLALQRDLNAVIVWLRRWFA